MLKRVARLFVIKSRLDAYLVIYALGLGAVERGHHYLSAYPGWGGYLLFAACSGAVFMAGAKILDGIGPRGVAAQGDRRVGDRRVAIKPRRAPPSRAGSRTRRAESTCRRAQQ